MITIPKNERVKIDPQSHWRLWLYGESYTGKTFLANKFPNVLMLNTDGNTSEVDAPRLRIANQYEQNGRITNEIPAWTYFKSVIAGLRVDNQGYETIVLDLIEDFYEFCRQYVCKEILHVSHESDANFKAWDMVRTEFYSVIRDLFSLPYNFILLSQEDKSRDIMERSGDKFTAVKPNIADKVALKLEGMCTLTARVMMKGKNNRVISFKNSDVIFGGGRIEIPMEEIPCDYAPLIDILRNGKAVSSGRNEVFNAPIGNAPTNAVPAEENTPKTYASTENIPATQEEPKRRRRRTVEVPAETPQNGTDNAETGTPDAENGTPSSENGTDASVDGTPSTDVTADPVAYGIQSDEEDAPAVAPKADEATAEEAPRRRRRRVVDESVPF